MDKKAMKASYKYILSFLLLLQLFAVQAAHAIVYEWGPTTHTIQEGDYNGDGRVDIYLSGIPAYESVVIPYGIELTPALVTTIRNVVLLDNGDGTFTVIYNPEPNTISSVSWSPAVLYGLDYIDFDNDGNNDLLIKPIGGGQSHVVMMAFDTNAGPAPTISTTYSDTDAGTGGDPEGIPARGSAIQPATQTAGLATPGAFSVSQSGKPQYRIQLRTPPNPGNIAPGLAMTYSGENGDSIFGAGWYVEGLSKITRCATSLIQDGYINGVNFNSSDKFCLNGQRLLAVSGNYGADGAIYRTENESFTRIESHGTGPDYFIVKKVTGEIEEYGNSDTTYKSRKFTADGAKAADWSVNKVEDREGNSATFYYIRNSAAGTHYIDKILYTNARIQFSYEARSDHTVSYANSVISDLPVRVSQIATYLGSNTTPSRTYTPGYQYSTATGRSRMNSLQECAGGVCAASTTFGWDLGTETVAFTNQSVQSDTTSYPTLGTTDSQQYLLADVNADGKLDLIWTYRNGENFGRVLYLANASGDGFTYTSTEVENGFGGGQIGVTDHRTLAGDVNGDGRSDLVWVARTANDVYRVVYLANSSGTGFISQGYEVDAYSTLANYTNGRYLLADVNGDRRSDLIWSYTDAIENKMRMTVYLARTDGSGSISLGKTSSTLDTDFSPQYYENQDLLTGDVNGDGKSDLVWMFTYQSKLYRVLYLANANGDGFTEISLQEDTFNSNWQDNQYLLGDVNGDGKADIIHAYKMGDNNGRTVYLASAAGTSHIKKDSVAPNEGVSSHTHRRFNIADLNGDGRSDLIYTYNNGVIFGWKNYTANMNGEGFTLQESNETTDSDPTHQNHVYQLGDVNADGKTDLVWTYNTSLNDLYRKLYTLPKSHPDHISTITNGLGVVTEVNYDYLANGAGSFYSKGTGSQYPVRDDNGLSYVVTQVRHDNGIGSQRIFDYRYNGAKTHLQGRGFLGFESRTVTDQATGFDTEEHYWQQFPLIGKFQSEEVRQSGGSLIERSYYHWKSYSTGVGTTFPYLDDQLTLKYDLTSGGLINAVLTENTYDLAHGNVTLNVLSTGSGFTGGVGASFNPASQFTGAEVSGLEQTISTSSGYLNNTSATWRIGFLNSRTMTYSAPGESNRVVQSSYTPYNSNTLLTLSETQYQGSGVSLTKTLSRDSFGNITNTNISGVGITGRSFSTSSYLYGIFPVNQINDLGFTEFTTFNLELGLLEQHADINGLTTDTRYDGFGRLLLTKGQDGSESLTTYATCATGCPANTAYQAITTTTHPNATGVGAPEQVEYFDKLHRLLRTEIKSFNGTTIYVDRVYDTRGNLDLISQPYFSGTPPWIDYSYDLLGRITNAAYADGGAVNTVYSNGGEFVTRDVSTTTVVLPNSTTNTIVSTSDRNALGQVRKVTDGESVTTELTYNAQGQPRLMRVDGNLASDVVVVTDVAGNRTQLVDPDVGTIDFDYDAAGMLRSVSHADGATITSLYDTLNRITTRTDTLGATTNTSNWVYDSQLNGIGKLSLLIGTDYYQTRKYDALSRLKQSNTRLFGEENTESVDYRYDAFSRLRTLKYPDGFQTETLYNGNGYQSEVRDADTPTSSYWLATAGDQWGNVTSATLGNGLITQYQYDANNGYLDTVKTGPTGTPTWVQNHDYGFDTVGNLHQRMSAAGIYSEALQETFTYDDLNRLKTANTTGLNGGPRSLSYDYDNLGNISYKSDVSDIGGYAYGANGGGVHAVSSVTLSTVTTQYGYDTRGNMTTAGDRALTYTLYNKPETISATGLSTAFKYGPERKRFHQLTTSGSRTTDTRYLESGLYEIVTEGGLTRRKAYVGDFLVRTDVGGAEELRYLHRDHIGSVDAISDASAAVVNRMTFAPFGARRDNGWEDSTPAYEAGLASLTFNTTTQGFTGHEHLDDSGFIHMGGRMYDPAIGRFASADRFVQFPEMSQTYNRYSYVLNNPLSHTDESGEFLPLIWGAIVLIERGYNLYDTVTSGAESFKTLSDENASFGDKVAAGLDLASRATGVKKVQRVANIIHNKAKGIGKSVGKNVEVKTASAKVDTKAPKAKGGDAETQNVEISRVSPSDVKFSQATASQNFSSNGTINNTVDNLRSKKITPDDIPAIRVVERNGELITLDNRRLAAFSAAGVKNIPVKKVSLSNAAVKKEFKKKFNPVNGGNNIVITPDSGGREAAKALMRSKGKIK
ncbi:MAG: VCBS repeat-containing protein [Thiotrichaceae bacterium]|nr:VCBS repeat-containing protein [Thiotrichaceae bacterium]